MELVLTIFSVLAVWALIALLCIALLIIRKPLIRVRLHLERIAMGVRAIEREVDPLGARTEDFIDRLRDATAGANEAAAALQTVDRSLETAIENDKLK